MTRHARLAALPAFMALTLAACQESAGPSENSLTLDVAVQATEFAAIDVEAMGGPPGPGGLGLFANHPGPFGPLAARDLGCRNVTPAGLTITRICTFTDAAGGAQETYDPLTTATARVQTTVAGEMSHRAWTATVDRTSDITVSGLAGTETQRTWNGSGSESVSSSRHDEGDGFRTYSLEATFAIEDLVIPRQDSPNRWPVSGSITRTLTGEFRSGPREGETFSRTTVLTFDGTATAILTVDGEEFTVDLAAWRAARRR